MFSVSSAHLWQLLGRIVPQLIALGVSVAMVRFAGLESVSQYALVLAVTSVSANLLAAALDVHHMRQHPRPTNISLAKAKLSVWVLLAPGVAATLWLLDVSPVAGLAVYAGLLLIAIAETATVAARLDGADARAVLPRIVPPALFLAALTVLQPHGFEPVALLFLAAWGLVVFLLPRDFRPWAVPAKTTASPLELILGARAFAATLLFTQVYGNADLFLIKLLMTHDAVGTYRLAQTFAAAVMPAIAVLTFVYLSEAQALVVRGDAAQLRRAVMRQLRLHAVVGVLALCGMAVVLPFAAPWLYGALGANVVAPGLVLTIAAILNALAMVFVYTLLALKQDRSVLAATAAAAVMSIGLNALLIPSFGILGAAWAGVLTFAGFATLLGLLARKYWRAFDAAARAGSRVSTAVP